MLQITIPAVMYEEFNDETNEFIYTVISKEQTLELEHSLDSLSRWESKWRKSFLYSKDKTDEEILDYIKIMTVSQNVDPTIYDRLTKSNVDQIQQYIDAPMTATTFSDSGGGKGRREVITAEIIYHWMIALEIPFDCQFWHLNKLITLIRVCNAKNQPRKKSNRNDTALKYANMNAARKKPKTRR